MLTEYDSLIGKIKVSDYTCDQNLFQIADGLGVPYNSQPIVCVKNGKPVLRKHWGEPVGLAQDNIRFVQIPRGDTLKNILQLVAVIGLSLLNPAGLIGLTGLGASLFNAAFVLGGTFLINTFLGPSVSVPKAGSSQSASPTYSLDGQGNRARILNPIPRLYGTHILYPDYASQAYQSYENNEQYLYQLFCLGVGEYQVNKINIDKTELWNRTTGLSDSFSDVELEIVPPGQKVTLFPANVITSSEVSGQELRNESFSGRASFSGNRLTFTDSVADIEYLSPGDQIIISPGDVDDDFTDSSAVFTTNRITFSSGKSQLNNIDVGDTVQITVRVLVDGGGDNQTTRDVKINKTVASKSGTSWIQFTSAIGYTGTRYVKIDYTYTPAIPNAGTYNLTDKDTSAPLTWLEFGANFTTASNVRVRVSLDNWSGPYVANPNNEGTDQIKIDVTLDRGLYYANDEGGLSNASVSYQFQARKINNLGDPIGSWFTLITETITRKTVTPQRFTKSFNVSLGRYEVRGRRTTRKNHDARYGNDITWGALRAFIPDDNIFSDVTLLATKIRASNQLTQQSSTQINVIQSGKIPVWNGTSWSAPVVTSNPAWIAADILRNSVYGADIPDERIDIAKLYELSQVYTARGDTFNGVFDTTRTLWDALISVLNVVRSQPILIAGKITFVRDQPRSLAKTVITPQSILKNTFEMTHIMKGEDSADDVIVEFKDEKTWEDSEVQATLPGSTSSQPARVQIFGITNRSQAWREGMYYAASNSYRRVMASVSTEADGRLLIKGDPVIVSHDVPQWSQNGFVMEYLADEKVLILDRAIKFADNDNVIILRRKDGKEFGPINVTYNGYDNEVSLNSGDLEANEIAQGITLNEVLSLDDEAKRTTFVFVAGGEAFVKRFIVVGSVMRDMTKVDLTLAIDDPRVYTADAGTPPPGIDYLGPGVTPNGPPVSNIYVNQDPFSAADPVTLVVSWTVAAGATQYILQYSPDGNTWSGLYSGVDTSTTVLLNAGDVYLRVAAVGTTLGPWKTFSGNFGIPSLLPGVVTNLTVNADVDAGTVEVNFDAAPRANNYIAEIYTESVANSEVFDVLKLTKTSSSTFIAWTTSEVTSAGGPWSRIEVRVSGTNDNGTGTATALQLTGIGLGSINGLSLANNYNGTDANIQWSPVSSASRYRVKVYNPSNVLVREVTVTSPAYYYSNSQLTSDGGPWRSFSISVRAETTNLTGAESVLQVQDLAPAYPTNIVSNNPSTGALTITWNQVMEPDVTSYRVYYSTTSGFTPGPSNLLFEGNALGLSASGIPAGTYYFVVMAKDNYAGNNGYNYSPQQTQVIT